MRCLHSRGGLCGGAGLGVLAGRCCRRNLGVYRRGVWWLLLLGVWRLLLGMWWRLRLKLRAYQVVLLGGYGRGCLGIYLGRSRLGGGGGGGRALVL